MKDEKSIRKTLEGMKQHQHFIKDDYQRYGFDNFRAGLEYCLDDNRIINAQIEAVAKDLGLVVKYVDLEKD